MRGRRLENNKQTQWSDEIWQQYLEQLEIQFSSGELSINSIKKNTHVSIVGYGEISTILMSNQQPDWVLKRLPIFESRKQADNYLKNYKKYIQLLEKARINTPSHREFIVGKNPRSLYLLQAAFNPQQVGNQALKNKSVKQQLLIIEKVVSEIEKIFKFNEISQEEKGDYLLSCDGQISNWAITEDQIYFIDTSTPLFKYRQQEQLEYELLLKSTPGFMRWIIRRFFLEDVLQRYYDKRSVYIDLLANLIKEQLSSLIPEAMILINKNLETSINIKEIENYYREDKFIWSLFLRLKKIDRWLYRYLYGKPYQYLLPDKIIR